MPPPQVLGQGRDRQRNGRQLQELVSRNWTGSSEGLEWICSNARGRSGPTGLAPAPGTSVTALVGETPTAFFLNRNHHFSSHQGGFERERCPGWPPPAGRSGRRPREPRPPTRSCSQAGWKALQGDEALPGYKRFIAYKNNLPSTEQSPQRDRAQERQGSFSHLQQTGGLACTASKCHGWAG